MVFRDSPTTDKHFKEFNAFSADLVCGLVYGG
jgi:hypothetical protein